MGKLNVHTTKDLWNNFYNIVYKLNQNKLSKKLTKPERSRLRHALLKQTKTPYDAGVFLYGVGGKSQITIQLDNGNLVCLTLFDQNDIGRGGAILSSSSSNSTPTC